MGLSGRAKDDDFDAAVRRVDELARRGEASICGVVCACGANGEPLACAFPQGHDGAHAWASLPTFQGEES